MLKLPDTYCSKDIERRILDAAELGQMITYRRKKLGYTQKHVAEFIGYSQKFISELERGVANASFEDAIKVITCLGLDMAVMERGFRAIDF